MALKNALSCTCDPEHFSISSTVRSFPDLPYETFKNEVLGATYNLSLVFVGKRRAKQLNEIHRGKSYVPNVLSFPLSEKSGEMYICPQAAKKEAAGFGLSFEGYVGFLFIHGMLHLAGHDHGDAMDDLELSFLKKFNLS